MSCPHCSNQPHLNTTLPPVDCPLLIGVGERDGTTFYLEVTRPSFVERKGDSMAYWIDNDPTQAIYGRFPWTYP